MAERAVQSPDASAIEFWFDFSSGYAYFAAWSVDDLAARVGRTVLWRPYMLGVAFKATGARGLSNTPLKGDYARHDWARISRRTGVPFSIPEGHPVTALPATRAYYWMEQHHPDVAHEFARRAFRAYFVEGVDTTEPRNVASVAAGLGADPDALCEAIASPAWKERVKAVSDEALAKGVFGSPFFLVDGEPFWGFDRMPMLEEWLREGGW